MADYCSNPECDCGLPPEPFPPPPPGAELGRKCQTCNGTGRVWTPEQDGTGVWDMACPDCGAPYPVADPAGEPAF